MHFRYMSQYKPPRGDDESRLAANYAFQVSALRSAITQAGWHLLDKAEELPWYADTNIAVIGFVTWSDVDLPLLDAFEDVARGQLAVFAIDLDAVSKHGRWEGFMPGAPPITQTPVIAIYSQGRLVDFGEGQVGVRQLLSRLGPKWGHR